MGPVGRAAALVLLVVAAGASTERARADEPMRPAEQRRTERRPVVVPPLDGSGAITVAVERDGTRRILSRGLRASLTQLGELSVAAEPLPTAKQPLTLDLPARFGGGYLFAASSGGRTALWKARTWSGELEPFANLDFEVARIVPGFDRLHLQARQTGEWASLAPETGAGIDAGGLPLAPSFGAMAFVDSWFGAVETPVRGTVVSFDAGASWHPLGVEVTSLSVNQGGSLLLGREQDPLLLDAAGRLRPAPPAPSPPPAGQNAGVVRESAFGRLPLRAAVLRGVPGGDGTALVLSRGVLGRVRLSDGRVLATAPRALPASRECSGIQLGDGHGFVCGEPRGATEVYAVDPPLGLRLRERFDTPRIVNAGGNGALVVSGRCAASAAPASARAVRCVVDPRGNRFELTLSSAQGGERVVALRDGRAAVIDPPSPGRPGSVRVVGPRGSTMKKPLAVEPGPAASLLENGFWSNELVEPKPGVLAGWVVTRHAFVGVRVELDGQVRLGESQRSIEQAVISGQRALVLGVSGLAEQTTDGGFTWSAAPIPASVESDSERAEGVAPDSEHGCSALGCVFRGWIRVGWSNAGAPPSPVAPAPTQLPSPGGGRWRLTCGLSGQTSRAALPLVPRPGYGSDDEVPSPWLPVAELEAPALDRGQLGLDAAIESEPVQARAYLFGPRTDFGKHATFLLQVVDRYRVDGGVWASGRAPSPWPDFAQALEAFGYDSSSTSGFRLVLDPSGRAGVLSLHARGSTDLLLLEAGAPSRRLDDVQRHGLGVVTSTVKLGTTYYVSTLIDTRSFRVFALGEGAPRLVGEYHAVPNASQPELVRGARGRGLGLWSRGAGWYVYPVDEQTGAAGRPLVVGARTLSRLPRVCSEDDEGYLLEGPIELEPRVEWSTVPDPRAAPRAIEGRFLVSANDVCVRELAAQVDQRFAGSRAAPGGRAGKARATVPLVVTDRGEGGRRYAGFCSEGD